jgi:hypothetical protein
MSKGVVIGVIAKKMVDLAVWVVRWMLIADIIDETENTGNLVIIPNGVIPISFSVWITAGLDASGAMCKDSGLPACQ